MDTVYFSLEPRDLVRRVGGGRKRWLGYRGRYSPGASREGKPGDVEIAIEKEGREGDEGGREALRGDGEKHADGVARWRGKGVSCGNSMLMKEIA